MLDPEIYVAELKAALRAGKPVTLTPQLADGRIISHRKPPDGGRRMGVDHEDITERRRAEQQLREQKLQLDTALNNMSQGLNMFDATGRLVVCNERYLQMYGLSPDVVKPGCTRRRAGRRRAIASGTFFAADPETLYGRTARRDDASASCEHDDGTARRPHHRRHQPADARRQRLGRHPRGHHRAPPHRDGARPQPGLRQPRDRERAGRPSSSRMPDTPALRADQSRRRGIFRRPAQGDDRQAGRGGLSERRPPTASPSTIGSCCEPASRNSTTSVR